MLEHFSEDLPHKQKHLVDSLDITWCFMLYHILQLAGGLILFIQSKSNYEHLLVGQSFTIWTTTSQSSHKLVTTLQGYGHFIQVSVITLPQFCKDVVRLLYSSNSQLGHISVILYVTGSVKINHLITKITDFALLTICTNTTKC